MQKLLALSLIAVPSLALAGDDPPKPLPMAKPKPSAELKELAGSIQGTWKCTGKASTDGTTQIDMKATMSNRTDVDGFWIQTNLTATMGKDSYKFTGFTGYNQSEHKFYRYMVDNIGGAEWNTATSINHGMADKWAIDWDGEQRMDMGPPPPSDKNPDRAKAIEQAKAAGILGTKPMLVKTKHSESFSKEGLAIKGEMSMDGGKTWVTGYDALCKK